MPVQCAGFFLSGYPDLKIKKYRVSAMTTSRYNCLYYPDLLAPAGGVEVHAAKVAESVDALVLGASGVTRESSSLSFRTNHGRVAIR